MSGCSRAGQSSATAGPAAATLHGATRSCPGRPQIHSMCTWYGLQANPQQAAQQIGHRRTTMRDARHTRRAGGQLLAASTWQLTWPIPKIHSCLFSRAASGSSAPKAAIIMMPCAMMMGWREDLVKLPTPVQMLIVAVPLITGCSMLLVRSTASASYAAQPRSMPASKAPHKRCECQQVGVVAIVGMLS